MPPQTPTPQMSGPAPTVSPVQPPASQNYSQPNGSNSILSRFSGGGGSLKSVLIKVGVIGGGLLILIIIFSSIFLKGQNIPAALTPVSQQQYNLLTVAQQSGSSYAVQQPTQNLTQDIIGIMNTDSYKLESYLKTVTGKTLSSKTVQSGFNQTTLTKLTDAHSANNFDSVYVQTIINDLKSYTSALALANSKIKGTNGKAMLLNDFKHAKSLYDEANVVAGSLNNG